MLQVEKVINEAMVFVAECAQDAAGALLGFDPAAASRHEDQDVEAGKIEALVGERCGDQTAALAGLYISHDSAALGFGQFPVGDSGCASDFCDELFAMLDVVDQDQDLLV